MTNNLNLQQLKQIIFSFDSSILDKGHISRHRFLTFSLPKIKGRIIAARTQLIFQPLYSPPDPLPARAAPLCLHQPLTPQDHHPSHPISKALTQLTTTAAAISSIPVESCLRANQSKPQSKERVKRALEELIAALSGTAGRWLSPSS